MTSKKLRRIRKLYKLTQAQFASKVNASRGQLGHWESERSKIPRWADEKISATFPVESDQIKEGLEPYQRLDPERRTRLETIERFLTDANDEIVDLLAKEVELLSRTPPYLENLAERASNETRNDRPLFPNSKPEKPPAENSPVGQEQKSYGWRQHKIDSFLRD